MSKPTVAVDFDGVIHEYDGWQGPESFGAPGPGAVEFLAELARKYAVVVHTTRRPDLVLAWLRDRDLLHFVSRVTNEKPLAVAYVDDRAVRFRGDFAAVLREIQEPPWWETQK